MARIILCEADADVRELLTTLLSRLGHEVEVAHPGGAPPDGELLILEPAAPAYLALAQSIRGRSPDLPVLCVSVLPEEADFLELGPLVYLVKPFALDDLRDAIAATLGSASRAA